MLIETGFHGADLFNEDGYNVAESAALYAKLLKEAIEQEFDGAEVVVNYDTDAGGVLPYNLRTRIDGIGASEADAWAMFDLMVIDDLHAKVFQEFEWVVTDIED